VHSAAASTRKLILSEGLVVVLSIIWGLAFVAIRVAVFELGAINLTLLRWIIVSAFFLALAPFIGRPKAPVKRKHVPRILLVSIASTVGYHLSLNYAETIVSSGLAGLLISFAPIFVVILSAVFLKEKIHRILAVALILAVIGSVILSMGADLSFQEISGPLAVVLAAFMYSVFSVGSKPLVKEYGALPVAVWAAVIGTVFILPLTTPEFFIKIADLSFQGWLSVLFLALLSTVVANMILYTLISRLAVSSLSIQLYLVPVVSLIGGVLILGETVNLYTVIGGVLLLVATSLATRKV